MLDLAPAGTTIVSLEANNPDFVGESCSAGGACYLGSVGTATTAVITVVLLVDSDFVGDSLTNIASVSADQPDPDPSDNISSASTEIARNADLALTKSALVDPVTAGELLLYEIVVENLGSSAAQNVLITDTIPTGTTLVGTSAGCTDSAPTITCTVGTLDAGETATVLVQVRVSEALTDGVSLDNTAAVFSPTDDDNPTNNEDTASVTVAQSELNPTDLEIRKDAVSATATAGETVAYTLVITNNGPADATNVQVADALPNGVTFQSAVPSQGFCNGSISCDLGDLAVGATATINVIGLIDPDVLGDINNVAVVSSANPDTDDTNNEDNAIVSVDPEFELTIEKTGTAAAAPGDPISYEIVVTNNGPSNAYDAEIYDDLPDVILNPVVTSSATCVISGTNGAEFFCEVDDLAPGDSVVVTVNGTLAPTASGTVVNVAGVEGESTDLITDTATTEIGLVADLVLEKVDSADPVQTGTNLVYTLTVTNNGPSIASGIVITDTLPPFGVSFVGASTGCLLSGDEVACTVPGTLPAGASTSVTITVAVADDLPAAYSLVNEAEVTSDTPDSNPDNNFAVEDTEVLAIANLLVDKTSSPNPVVAGETVTYTILVTNTGPAQATDVRIIDTLPQGLEFRSATASNAGVCNSGVLCLLGTMDVGEVAEVTIVAEVDGALSGGTALENVVAVFSEQLDPPEPITDDDTLIITEEVDLAVEKQDFPDPAAIGGGIRYRILVENFGPSTAFDVVITDTLPGDTSFVQATVGFNCQEAGGIVTCDIGTLEVGEQVVIEIDVNVLEGTGLVDDDTITNTVIVGTSSTDINPFNNTDTEDTTVRVGTDVQVSKVGPTQIIRGETLTYTIDVVLNGPSTAENVVVTDTLPAALITNTVTVMSSVGMCTQNDSVIVCDIGDMTLGITETVRITVTGETPPDAPPVGTTIVNLVEVDTDSFDFNPDNDAGSFDTLVVDRADLGISKSVSPAEALAGRDTVTYTVVVSNAGPSLAVDIFIDDPLPEQLTLISADVTDGFCTGSVLCFVDTLAPGDSVMMTVVASVDEDAVSGGVFTNTIPNTASVTAAVLEDPNILPNVATAEFVARSEANLQITKYDLDDPVQPGDPIFYSIVLTNTGPSVATDVVITDTLNALMTFESASVDCSHDGSPTGGVVRCEFDRIAVGERVQIDVVVSAPIDQPTGTVITNTVLAQAGNSLPVTDQEPTTVEEFLGAPADLEVSKVGGLTAVAGEQVTYTIVITNNGPATAQSVDLKDVLPDGLLVSDAANVATSPGSVLPIKLWYAVSVWQSGDQ